MNQGSISVRRVEAEEALAQAGPLADVLLDCIEGGASVGFMASLDRPAAEDFWRKVAKAVAAGRRILFVAEDAASGEIVGTAQLVLAQADNQPHRADLSKVLVLRSARGRGAGAALMQATEEAARAAGRTVLVLDTATPEAERLYERAGWSRAGTVPAYALMPDGSPCATTFFYKQLD
jgi:GNAT superfamily N-acetyltransferase